MLRYLQLCVLHAHMGELDPPQVGAKPHITTLTCANQELEFNLEVLDDFVSEAAELKTFNPWLTYGLPLHLSREFGLQDKLFDLLDERALNASEVGMEHAHCIARPGSGE